VLLTVTQVAERLGVGRTTVFDLLRSGDLPRLKIGSATRVSERDLQAYIDRLRGEQPAGEPEAITTGQNRALHAMSGRLDRQRDAERGTAKAAALAAASEHFGRTISSATMLSSFEASYVLDWLEERLAESR
jgi:excisionase family DNA binding protein